MSGSWQSTQWGQSGWNKNYTYNASGNRSGSSSSTSSWGSDRSDSTPQGSVNKSLFSSQPVAKPYLPYSSILQNELQKFGCTKKPQLPPEATPQKK